MESRNMAVAGTILSLLLAVLIIVWMVNISLKSQVNNSSPMYTQEKDEAKKSTCKINQQALKTALDLYQIKTGRPAQSQDDLINDGEIRTKLTCPSNLSEPNPYTWSSGDVICNVNEEHNK